MPALDISHDVARRHKRPPAAAHRQPDVRPASRSDALPPATNTPAAARAGEMVAAPAAKPDTASRAQMSVALQQNVGNARMATMTATAAHPQLPKQQAKAAPHDASKKEEHAPVKAAAPAHGKPAHAKGAAEGGHGKGAEKKAPAKGGPPAKQAIAPAIKAVRQRAGQARKHTPAGSVVTNAQAAAISPKTEQTRGAAVQTVATIDSAKAEKVKRDSFRAKLREAIDKATPKPKTESEADHVMKAGAAEASTKLHGSMSAERDAAAGPLKGAAKDDVPPSTQPEPPKVDLKPETVGAPPAPVSAGPVVPAPLPPERLDYSSDRASTDNAMEENHISKDQLAKGNEPAFKTTLDARSTAETHEATAEAKYRKEEANVQGQAHTAAAGALAGGLGAIHGLRGLHVGNVAGHQTATQKKNAQERQRITDTITIYKNAAKLDVDKILTKMEEDAGKVFETALARAEKAYEDTFEDAKGGLGTWLTTWGDKWKQLIEDSLATAREEYLRQVGIGIDEVANLVDAALDAAKKRVADGRKQVADFVAGLDKSVRGFGDEAMQSVSADFDAMSSEIDQRGDQLVEKLTAQYKASYERMSAKEEALREANKSLWERVYDATVGVIKKILAFKDMLVNVLRKAANVVLDIISDPIGFLGNLVEGVMTGLRNFMKNIGTHLKRGLMEWLFGALAGAGLKMPEEFDLKGIVSIVLQVLGLTYANFRARAVAIVGEGVVSGLEKAAEIFKIIATEGIAGLWKFIKEKVEDLKSMVLDAIFDFIKERVLIAGVTWVIGLLNPASAFFKACKAIYDIVKFFIERGSEILALINAIIDSIAAIAKGQLATAAKWVEEALAKTIPIAIGFLASLLGLGDISGTIKKTIDRAQAPVNKAIDWAIGMAVKGAKALGNLVKGAFGKKDPKEKKTPPKELEEQQHDAKVEAGLRAIDEEEAKVAPDSRPTIEEAQAIAQRVHQQHPVFLSITVVEGGDHWDYHWTGSEGKKAGHKVDKDVQALIDRLNGIPKNKGVGKLIKILSGKLHKNMRNGYMFQAERTLYWHGQGLLLRVESEFENARTDQVSVFDIVINDPDGAREKGKKVQLHIDTKNWQGTSAQIARLEQYEEQIVALGIPSKDETADQKKQRLALLKKAQDTYESLDVWIEKILGGLVKRLRKYRATGLNIVIEWKGDVPDRVKQLEAKRTKRLGSVTIIPIKELVAKETS